MAIVVCAAFVALALVVPQPTEAAPKLKVPVCHKFGTPAQKTLYLPYEGAMGHIQGHGDFPCACPVTDRFIDVDGIATPGRGLPGGIDAGICGSLTSWPTSGGNEGIDWFDNDGSCTWTLGDDLHLEDTFGACSTAIRNASHDLGADCVVLDLDSSFFNGQPVDVDLEFGIPFTGCPGVDPALKFFDANGNSVYDNGEDIILDVNLDGLLN
jgi:hypothetical protein